MVRFVRLAGFFMVVLQVILINERFFLWEMVGESELERALRSSWSRETSSDPENWSPSNPAWGQCAVTALVVNDYLQGEIVWAKAVLPDGRTISHYFNKIRGSEKDFTRSQFPEGTIIPEGVPRTQGFPSTVTYLLSNNDTARRYLRLKESVEEVLRRG